MSRFRIACFFVMDGLRFEAGAILLAVSLRAQMGKDIQIIAYVPEDKVAGISRVTRKMLSAVRARVRPIPAGLAEWAEPYPHGNKLLAAIQPRDADYSIFLDTDTVCIGPLDFIDRAAPATLYAVPEGVATWGRHDEDWTLPYGMFGLALPSRRVRLTRGRRRSVLPYFNAGMVAFPETGSPRFADLWLDTALKLDHVDGLNGRRPWLDQISLPVAAARAGLVLNDLNGGFNYSPYRRRAGSDADVPRLFHYHMPSYYRAQHCCRAVTRAAFELCPPHLQSHLQRKLRNFLVKEDTVGGVPAPQTSVSAIP